MEWVGAARRHGPAVHKRGSRCALPRVWESKGRVKQRQFAQEFLVRGAHSCIMPGKEWKGNPDPSRGLGSDGGDTASGDRGDRAALRGSAGDGGWRNVAGGAVRAGDRGNCNSAGRDHSSDTGRTGCGIRCSGKPVVEGHRPASPCALAGGTGQWLLNRGRLEPVCLWLPDEGCHTGTPSLATAGFLLFPPSKVTLQRNVVSAADRTDDPRLRRR
jgi:hypothetical protein